VHEVQDFFFFNTALRLVALVQPSSCSLERDFSQFKLIVDSRGQMMQDTLESRACERCNNGQNGLPPIEKHRCECRVTSDNNVTRHVCTALLSH
jgi:hypothetical protein